MPDWWVQSDALRDMLVDMGRMPPPRRRFDLQEIEPGWLVYDTELERIGRVLGQIDGYLVVQRRFGRLYVWLRLYIPATAIGGARQGSVFLNVSRSWLGGMGWNHPPRNPSDRLRHG